VIITTLAESAISVRPVNPRNPQAQSITGQAKDDWAEET